MTPPVARAAGIAALALLLASLPLSSASAKKKKAPDPSKHEARTTISRGRVLMGTLLTVIAEAVDSTNASSAVEAALGDVQRLDEVLSSWRADSELSRLNQSVGGVRERCSQELYDAAAIALELASETEGAFDPTVEPLMRAWDMRGHGREPTRGELNAAMERVGWRRLIVDSGQRTIRFQRDGMGLDFGGVGKGIALDRAAKILKDRGVRRALFNFGGELLAFGDRGAWSAQIADPEDRDRAVVNLFVREAAVSTSSQSERGVTVGAHRYGHTLDPRTGHPVETVASVTVVTKSGARADALSTALLVMGREAAEAFLEDRTDVGALWIEREGGELKVWRWRLPSASAIAGVPLKWMN